MQKTILPDTIATAAARMLADYIPGLTAERLVAAISYEPHEEKTEKLLTRKEAAAVLNISLPTLDRALYSGELPRRKIRGAVRIPQSAINRFIAGIEIIQG